MDPEKKSLNFIFPTKYVIPKSLKFSYWLSEVSPCNKNLHLSASQPKMEPLSPIPKQKANMMK